MFNPEKMPAFGEGGTKKEEGQKVILPFSSEGRRTDMPRKERRKGDTFVFPGLAPEKKGKIEKVIDATGGLKKQRDKLEERLAADARKMLVRTIEKSQGQKKKEDAVREERKNEWEEKGGKKVFAPGTQAVLGRENQEMVSLNFSMEKLKEEIKRCEENQKSRPEEKDFWQGQIEKKSAELKVLGEKLRKSPDQKNLHW